MNDQPEARVSIDRLIEMVKEGARVRTGVDIFSQEGRLLLQENVLIDNTNILLNVKRLGVNEIPIDPESEGGLWDSSGKQIDLGGNTHTEKADEEEAKPPKTGAVSELDRRIEEIQEIKATAEEKYQKAKKGIIKAIESIRKTGGEFDCEAVSETVNEIFDFVNNNENAFSYLTREIFSYDDYLYNHSINVCTIGTVVMKKFNENFSAVVNSHLDNIDFTNLKQDETPAKNSFSYFLDDELRDISIGFFMHDMGKVLIDRSILNKEGQLTAKEFEIVKTHSTSKGAEILEKNNLANPYILNTSLYHHARLFADEERCYPENRMPNQIPPYVKVCKLADIYDAMTSKRCYKEALNPVGVVTDVFHRYAEKDRLLQFILHSFVKSVGIYPPGSVVLLSNGQMAYVLDSHGPPTLIPITDTQGNTLEKGVEPFILTKETSKEKNLHIDRRRPPVAPVEAYKFLPDYLKKTVIGKQLQ